MNPSEALARIGKNLLALGPARLGVLATVGIALVAALAVGLRYASQPDFTTLYANLDRQDVNAVGDALSMRGIAFDVTADGTSVLVPPADLSRARMLLAEQGLPRSTNAGYELFDQIGSLGLTSFMQDVTLVRALEGEIARTIRTVRGISAARVHLVLPERRGLARDRTPPTASVVVRGDGLTPGQTSRAIRHMVAAAVPGLTVDAVTVMDTDGTLLAGGEDGSAPNANALFGLEQTVAGNVEQNIRRALQAIVGPDNLRISVSARLNTDRRQIAETTYDPDARVERTLKVSKESGSTQNSAGAQPATIAQELPEDAIGSAQANQSQEARERREEVTDYAISSRTVNTESDGYAVEALSIAVVVNRKALGEGAAQDKIDAIVGEMRGLIGSAGGVDEERGDRVTLTVADFAPLPDAPEMIDDTGFGAMVSRNSGTLIRSSALIAVTLMILLFGLRPALKAVAAAPDAIATDVTEATGRIATSSAEADDPAADIAAQMEHGARRRLERIVALDEDKAAAVLKQWLAGA